MWPGRFSLQLKADPVKDSRYICTNPAHFSFHGLRKDGYSQVKKNTEQPPPIASNSVSRAY
ncbi:hypothetical protein IF1G_05370 [Cordyceps javanica]|uniref:Uncharacterized protein n=1 Tax=Cordyceps javanica TaxID=43265 RepID=A0A545VZY9_9HYPO|nr:hypothetical protein IF1G_05370 [Cordyceps javanica]TQW07259.1 hypothetical protein IF2G_05643 [Cordyceps javanica]